MTDLVACLGTDPKLWNYIEKLTQGENWDNIHLICSTDSSSFSSKKKISIIQIDLKTPLPQLTSQIRNNMDGKINDTEIAVNLALGAGKEHMAVLSALIKLGLGIRLVALTPEGVREV
ncbi:hypothetical protein HYU11_03540 [Candidatus Woesearchaeota archaeon]|nr:hypothetical protein [Candidatus Woesearchaeota archaeon]